MISDAHEHEKIALKLATAAKVTGPEGWKIQIRKLFFDPITSPLLEEVTTMSGEMTYERLVCISRLLLRTQVGQSAPLWPALAEIPVPIDRMGYSVPTLQDEYVLWPN